MIYRIQDIANIISPASSIQVDATIEWLAIDSRKIIDPAHSLFFALSSTRRDGHDFIRELFQKGVRNFVVRKGYDHTGFEQANFLETDHVLSALQQLAAYHREHLRQIKHATDFPVIGITGSNGKTIVKEWLNQLLSPDHIIVRSPRSYNSQIGVPLSVWQINEQHTLGIFEAGISTTGEMDRLEKIIQPTIGVFTCMGDAHGEGFASRNEKFSEKIKLFTACRQTVLAIDSLDENEKLMMQTRIKEPFTWSRKENATLRIIGQQISGEVTLIRAQYQQQEYQMKVPFTDPVSIDNVITCWSILLLLGYAAAKIAERMLLLEPVNMRMQLKSAINHCYLINDSYSNDISSLPLAIAFLQQKAGDAPMSLILSDILQAGIPDKTLYEQVASLLEGKKIHRLIGIGKHIVEYRSLFNGIIPETIFYPDTESFLQQATHHQFQQEYILLRGARIFEFERISQWLELQQHQTLMEINLTAMAYNLKCYQQKLKPDTKMMAMVKAFSYGSGTVEVARLLELHQVDYLAVAYADEGVVLRKAGIRLPIMVMNADEASFDALLEYHLEPELYSMHMYRSFAAYLQKQALPAFPVHLKLNTGMNRLGFSVKEIATITALLNKDQLMQVRSVFSHLAASESADFDQFTRQQAANFDQACIEIRTALGYDFIKHLSNTAAIFRNPDLQYDMVRLGIGLYGVDSSKDQSLQLQTVNTLKSTIAQIHSLEPGDTVGYGRKGVITRPSKIATVRIGYADGFNRRLGNGRASMYVKGGLAPVVGNICMDMTMIDVTDIEGVEEGDQVEIFGPHLSVEQIAAWSDTIPYEILTGISQRVKRVYLEE